MTNSSFEEQLEKYGSFTFRNTGVSMMPLLKQGRDLFTVRRIEEGERLKKYDVALYHRGEYYVLHRVLKVTDTGYIIRGDNCISKEIVPESDIMAVMTGYVRKGKEYSVTDRTYINYTKRMLFFSPLRIFFRRSKIRVKNVIRKITGSSGKQN